MTLTTRGLAAAIASGVGIFAGLAVDAPFLLGVGLVLGSLLLVGALSLRSPELRLRRTVEAETAHEGDVVPVVLRIEAARRHGKSLLELREGLPGEVELEDGNNYALLDLKPGEAAELRYRIRCPVKGFHKLGPVRVRVEDPFGFFHRDQEAGEASTVKVYPLVEDLKTAHAKSKYPFIATGPFLVGNPGSGSAFFALREYVRGDSMRDVNWKASARSKEMMVNQRERETQSEITLLLDRREASVVGTRGKNTFLYTCRAAVSLTELFLDNRSKVALVMYGDGIDRVVKRQGQNLTVEVLEAVTAAVPGGDLSLAGVVDEILPSIKPRTPVFLLSSLVDDPGIDRAVATLRAYGCQVVVVSPSATAFARLVRAAAAEPAGPAGRPGQAEAGQAGGDAGPTAGAVHDDFDLALMEAQRERALAGVRGMGALTLDWEPDAPLSVSLQTGVV